MCQPTNQKNIYIYRNGNNTALNHENNYNVIQFVICIHFFISVRIIRRVPINLAVLSLIESGELTKLFNKWWFDRTECQSADKQDASRNELSLSNVAGIFFILIGGLLVSLLVALLEFCFRNKDDGRKQPHINNQSVDLLKSKSKLTIQQGREFDNGRVEVDIPAIQHIFE